MPASGYWSNSGNGDDLARVVCFLLHIPIALRDTIVTNYAYPIDNPPNPAVRPVGDFAQRVVLLDAVTTNTTGPVYARWPRGRKLFQVKLSGTSGPVSCVVKLWGSNDPLAETDPTNCAKQLLATISLSGTGSGAGISADQEFQNVEAAWVYYWMTTESISGTGATVSGWGG